MRSLFHTAPRAAVLLVLLSAAAFAQEKTTTRYNELPRFQQVSDRLYRSAQPRAGGMSRLRELGINTVINLRGTSERTRAEGAEIRALGLNYYNIALPNWGRPQDARVARVLAIINAPESGNVLIHCKDGVDRTGMIVAIHRMTQQGWTSDDALAEAERYGMRRIQVWMRDYVEDYGQQEDLGDRIGAGMRVVERGAFQARNVARSLRKFSASLH